MRNRLVEISSRELKDIVMESVNILLNERHVIKLPKQDPPMPPMDMQQPPMGGGDPAMGGADPTMGDMNSDPMGDEIGNDENGEGTSERDELRQKVGDVAHLLQSDSIEGEDAKSALNTIIQQAKKKMDGSELKKSADKLTSVDDASENSDGDGSPLGGDENDEGMQDPTANKMESRRYLKRVVNEMLGDVISNDSIERQKERKKTKEITNDSFDSPFVSHF